MPGAVVNGLYLNTESGLNAPGGFVDRLQQALDSRAQAQGVLQGLSPALQASGVPVAPPQGGVLSAFLGKLGLGSSSPSQTSAPQAASPSRDDSASPVQSPTFASPTAGSMPVFLNALASVESKGSGDYNALGPVTKSGDQALGKYQVMASNVGPWTKEVLGQEMTPQQFLASPQAQDAVTAGKFHQFLVKTGNPQDAASMWFTGRPLAQGADKADQLGTTGAGYVAKFLAALPGTSAGSAVAAGSSPSMPVQAAAYTSDDEANVGSQHPYAPAAIAQAAPPNGAGASGTVGDATSVHPGEVLGPLMANPATRAIGASLWKGSIQQGGGSMSNAMTLPAGMTPEALAQMIATPQTMEMGLGIWQRAMFPQVQAFKPGDYLVRGTQPMGQVPSVPMDVGPGHMIKNPNTGATIAAVPPELQHAEIGRDAYGQPTYGAFNPQGGAVAPFSSGQGNAASGTATDALGQPLSGAAFLGSLPPAIAGQVKAIAEGRVKLPSGMGAANPMAQRMRAAVLQYDPSFDQAGVDARFETRADFAKGDAAKTITAGNTALIHLGELSDLAGKLGNADTSLPVNNAYNWAINTAKSGGAAGAPLAAFNATASKYVEEATKFYRGTGGTEGDISRDMLNLSPNMSPTQIKAAIGAQIPLIQGKVDAMQSRWRQGMGPQAGDYPIMSPQAQSVLDRLGPQASSGTAPVSSSLPVAAPASGSSTPAPQSSAAAGGALDQARAAIARGAPRGAVLQRLQQMGVNPAGL